MCHGLITSGAAEWVSVGMFLVLPRVCLSRVLESGQSWGCVQALQCAKSDGCLNDLDSRHNGHLGSYCAWCVSSLFHPLIAVLSAHTPRKLYFSD